MIVGGAWKYDQSDWFSLVMLVSKPNISGEVCQTHYFVEKAGSGNETNIHVCVPKHFNKLQTSNL